MDVPKELEAIQARNKRVELDKAWEISWTRRLFITASTYIIASLWLTLLHESIPFLKAIVPAGGYLLSTLSLVPLKEWWIRKKIDK